MDELRKLRLQRDSLLAGSDWSQLQDAPISEQLKEAYKVYRQALRDLPENTDPINPIFPEPPKESNNAI